MSEHAVSQIQRDAFKDIIDQFTQQLVHTNTFTNLLREALENSMDSLADNLAEKVCDSITDCIDPEDVVRNSSALGDLEQRLEEVVQNAVDNITL